MSNIITRGRAMPGSQSTAEKSRNEGYNIDITGVICETLYHFEKFFRISL